MNMYCVCDKRVKGLRFFHDEEEAMKYLNALSDAERKKLVKRCIEFNPTTQTMEDKLVEEARPEKVKKPRSEAQIEAFKKCQEKRRKLQEERNQAKSV